MHCSKGNNKVPYCIMEQQHSFLGLALNGGMRFDSCFIPIVQLVFMASLATLFILLDKMSRYQR
jgi:hypothetical protein